MADRFVLQMTFDDYYENVADNNGYCPDCGWVTRFGFTEPDVTPEHDGYACPDCGHGVYGVEMAMASGLIEVVEKKTPILKRGAK